MNSAYEDAAHREAHKILTGMVDMAIWAENKDLAKLARHYLPLETCKDCGHMKLIGDPPCPFCSGALTCLCQKPHHTK